ncbi:hypothetical protein HFO24_13925 [Rhizobium laguerreae]|uniref:hypothetical protein n=1 Tax=Rhizobium laguerreae TaxID=1076926 RepID=UPI001C92268E|nr:hypothetical protein [Rhizobium laguerreae]MBY3182758.1 hypothetical protein [Rhizobium laguerreae]
MNSRDSAEKRVGNLTREVLVEASPNEIFLLDSYDPNQSDLGAACRGPLGFGIAEAGALLLPVVYALFQSLLKEATSEASRALVSKIKAQITALGDKPAHARETLFESIDRYLEKSGISEERRAKAVPAIFEVVIRHHADMG